MRTLIAAAGLLLVTGWTAGGGADDDAAKAAKKLEGTYEVVTATLGGKPARNAANVKSIVIKDGEIVTDYGNRGVRKAKFTVDPSKKPAEIDMRKANAKEADAVGKGIYQTKDTDKGLELTIAFSSVRPKDFKGEGAEEIVLILLRKK